MKRSICAIAILVLFSSNALTQSTRKGGSEKDTNQAGNIQPAATTPVTGSGTLNRLAKWLNTSAIGDSTITEDKFGKVGIGTSTPTSPLTVQGMIETTSGGVKFPDGSMMTSAAGLLTSVQHDATLQGDGSAGSPLGLAAGVLNVEHDQTLRGNGSAGSPLGLEIPLIFAGDVNNGNGVITVTNTAAGGPAIFAVGGLASNTIGGGSGLLSLGGTGASTSPGGVGLVGFGGSANQSSGGTGGTLIGGVSNAGNGGDGLFAVGALGVGTGKKGGRGIVAIPGGGAGGAIPGLAGEFLGDVEVSGTLSKGGGSFKIDHPLDPENKYLYHSFVESPDMKNIYDGSITTDQNGEATVELPDWFQALNRDFRYQLTVIGTFAQAIVGEKIKGNRFIIQTNAPNVEVSWQVTGIRKDGFADKHRIPVEEMKQERERGFYLHPEAFNQPAERGVAFARYEEAMRKTGALGEKTQKAKED